MINDPIVVSSVRKEYGSFVALDDLTLTVKKNSFTGLLGPNGAGKSTLLKISSSLIRPTSGSVSLNGVDPTKDPAGALEGVGLVIETPEFYPYLTPRETLRYVGGLLGMRRESISSETEEVLEKMKMTRWADEKMGTFSKGMKQRIALGHALLNDPEIIILDEPTSGLDPRGMMEMRDVLKNLRADNGNLTVLMSSHMLHEVGDLCDHVSMVSRGKLIMDGSIDEIRNIGGKRTLSVKTDSDICDLEASVTDVECVVKVIRTYQGMDIVFDGGREEQARLLRMISNIDEKVYSVYESGGDLESAYMNMIAESR